VGKAQRKGALGNVTTQTPGPNDYLPNIDVVKRNAANWSIKPPPSQRYETPDNFIIPGPGAYNINPNANSELRSAPRAFIAGKYEKRNNKFLELTPSPLEYSPSVAQVTR
jgi:hypothetical protein